MLTLEHYFAGYPDHPGITEGHRQAAIETVRRANVILGVAGVPLRINPHTDSRVSGQTNGGWRPRDCPIGAANSHHKLGQAVDIYDPYRELATWCANHLKELEEIGLWMEDFRWTPSWVHFQTVSPGSDIRVFIPSNTPPLAPPVEGQKV